MSLADLIPELDRRLAERLETSLAGFEAALRDHLDRSHARAISELGALRPRGLALLTAEDLAPLGAAASSGARSGAFEDLLAAARAVDAAGDQVELLCRLLEGARHFGSRAALLVASPNGGQGWAAVGFGEGVRPLPIEIPWVGSWAGFAEGRGAVMLEPVDAAPIAQHFGAAPATRAVAVPFVLGSQVGGALYVDSVEGGHLEVAAIQLLASLAAARLESGASRPSTPTLYQASERAAGGLGLWTAQAAGAAAVTSVVAAAVAPAAVSAVEPADEAAEEPVAEEPAPVSPDSHQKTFEETSAEPLAIAADTFEVPTFDAVTFQPDAIEPEPAVVEPAPTWGAEPEVEPELVQYEEPASPWSSEPVVEEVEDVPTDVHSLGAAPEVAFAESVEEDLWAPEPAVQSTAYAHDPEVVAAYEPPPGDADHESAAVSERTAGFLVEPTAAYREPVFETDAFAEAAVVEEVAVEEAVDVEPMFEPELDASPLEAHAFTPEVVPEFEPLDAPAFEVEPPAAADVGVFAPAFEPPTEPVRVDPPRVAATPSIDATVAVSQSLLREYALGQQQSSASVAATGPVELPPVVASEDETVMLRRPPVAPPAPTSPEDDTNPTISRSSAQVAPPADLLRGGQPGGGMVAPPMDLQGPGWAFRAGRQGGAAPAAGGAADPALEEARRLARLLVSEIKLYNEEQVEEGRRNRDLYKRLKDDIEHSREVYNGRVDPRALEHDFFREALVRVLAGGDPNALGV